MKKKMILFALAVCILWGALSGSALQNQLNSVINNLYPHSVGEHIFFGHYEQDNNTKNGAEPIEWIVLEANGSEVVMISRYVLDAQRFNDCWAEITWEDSSLRWWLNNTFYNKAFTGAEQQQIRLSSVQAEKNPYYKGLNPGSSTFDKVYLLSVTEAERYFKNSNLRMTSATDYARRQGAFISKSYTVGGRGSAWWWLRSPGGYQGTGYKSYAAMIDGSGAVSGHEVFNSGSDGSIGGIRPVIRATLK